MMVMPSQSLASFLLHSSCMASNSKTKIWARRLGNESQSRNRAVYESLWCLLIWGPLVLTQTHVQFRSESWPPSIVKRAEQMGSNLFVVLSRLMMIMMMMAMILITIYLFGQPMFGRNPLLLLAFGIERTYIHIYKYTSTQIKDSLLMYSHTVVFQTNKHVLLHIYLDSLFIQIYVQVHVQWK